MSTRVHKAYIKNDRGKMKGNIVLGKTILRNCDCNWTRTHNHLVHKRTLNHLAKLAKWLSCVVSTYLYGAFDCMFLSCHQLASLAKWLSVRLWTKWLWVRVQLQSLKLQISRLLPARSSWTFRQLQSVDSLWNAYVTW